MFQHTQVRVHNIRSGWKVIKNISPAGGGTPTGFLPV